MSVSDIIFITDYKISRCTEILSNATRHWMSQWCMDDFVPEIGYLGKNIDKPDMSTMKLANSTFSMITLNDDNCNWIRIVFGGLESEFPADQIGIDVIQDAKSALIHGIQDSFCETAEAEFSFDNRSVANDSSSFKTGPGDSNAVFKIVINGESFELTVPSMLMKHLRKTNVVPQRSIDKLSIRSFNNMLSAHVSLDLGSHPISDINSLEVGDILVSSTKLSTPFKISVNGKEIAKANLGKFQGKKSIKLLKNQV